MEFLMLYLLACAIVALGSTLGIMVPVLPLLQAEKYAPLNINVVKLIYIVSFFTLSYILAPIMLYIISSEDRVREFITAFSVTIVTDPKKGS